MYEITSKGVSDNWYFYDDFENSKQPSISNYVELDYIIIVNSDSNGNGNWDDFSLRMTLSFEGHSDDWLKSYSFGDKAANKLQIGIWQISYDENFTFVDNGGRIASLSEAGLTYSSFNSDNDWGAIWDCLKVYFDDGDEQEVENKLIDFSFPKP